MATAPSPIIMPQNRNQKVDENGEVIIAEAIFSRYSLYVAICLKYLVYPPFMLALLVILFPCGLIYLCLGCVYGCRGASAWRLYLTSTGIHYTSVSSRGCVREKKFIPLSNIRDASPQETIKQMRSTKWVDTNTLKIIQTNYEIVKFTCILNATDFCDAIKQQKQA